jgi:hypothetical protein
VGLTTTPTRRGTRFILLREAKCGEQNIGSAPRAAGRCRFDAPWTVDVHAYLPVGKRLVLHLVNYDQREKAAGKSVSAQEVPVAARLVAFHLQLPEKLRTKRVRCYSPDGVKDHAVAFKQKDGLLKCTTPRFLVYGLGVVEEEAPRCCAGAPEIPTQ